MASNRPRSSGPNMNIPAGVFSSEMEKETLLKSMDKKQNEDERRQIRQNYRQLLDELAENKQELINPSDQENLLQQQLKKADTLFANVRQAREGSLDSTSLVQIADLGMKKAQALQTDFVRFYPTDFCEKVKVVIAGELDSSTSNPFSHEDWVKLGTAVQPLFRTTPVLRFMCGSFERGEVSVQKRARMKKDERIIDNSNGKKTQPTQLSRFETMEGGELTTAYVEHVLKTLWDVYEESENEPVDFFEFVTHPTSFGQTVENIFYTSFLIRDGHARLSLDSEQLPVIEPIQKEEGGSEQETTERKQLVLELTPAEWKQIVKTFKIEEPVIKSMTSRVIDQSSQGSSSQSQRR